jgi:hypothetical protein
MSRPPLQDIAAPRWDVANAAEAGDGGISSEIKGACAESGGPRRYSCSADAPGHSSAKDWGEIGGGIRLPVWNNGAVTASVTASITPNQTNELRLAPRRRAGILRGIVRHVW